MANGNVIEPTVSTPGLRAHRAPDAGNTSPSPENLAEDVLRIRSRAMADRLKFEAVKNGLGLDENRPAVAPAPTPGIKMDFDIGQYIASTQSAIAETHKLALEMMGKAATAEQKAIADSLTTRLETVQRDLDDARSSNSMSAFLETYRAIKDLEKDLKAEALESGAKGPPPAPAYDPHVTIELKKMEIDFQLTLQKMAEDRQQRHEEFLWQMKKFDMEREDAKERHGEEMGLRRQQMALENEGKKATRETFTDILHAASRTLDEALANGGGGVADLRPSVGQPATAPGLEEFECQECHHKAMVDPRVTAYTCPNCKMAYTVS